MKKYNLNYQKRINYSEESVDLIQMCCISLKENNFYKNDKLTNLKNLEQFLINYTTLKLYSWDICLENLEVENFINLNTLLKTTSQFIPSDDERNAFFSQYVHCILYIYQQINNQPNEIKWDKTNNELNIRYIFLNNTLTKINTGKNIAIHKIPTALLTKFKSIYEEKEKNPVLTK